MPIILAMVCHGRVTKRAPDDGAANRSMSASINFVTSSLKLTSIDVCMHMHARMQSVQVYGASCGFWRPPKLFGESDLRTARGGADPSRMPPRGPQRASHKHFTITDGQRNKYGGIPFLD